MTSNKTAEKLYSFELHALPTGNFNFLKIDPDDPEARAFLCLPDLTETEVRVAYETQLGLKVELSDAQIEECITAARQKLKNNRDQ
ncbi:MAG TPA: hypothetical protein VK752_21115 [Bryobacteraceae bacterium]|jgi:hypothetical protein|nr:hypothetical protein [Bryobacteraceae bacterium]